MTDWLAVEAAVGVAFLLGLALGALGALAAAAMVSGANSALDRAAGALETLAAQVGALEALIEAHEVKVGGLGGLVEEERQDGPNDEASRDERLARG